MIDTKAITHIVGEASGKVVPKAFFGAVLREMEREDVERVALAYLLLRLSQRKRAKVRSVEVESVFPKRTATRAQETREEEAARREGDLELQREYAARIAAREERERANAEVDARLRAEMWQGMTKAMETYRVEVIQEWTNELLAQTFATGDGRSVTWGKATVADHRARIAMQERNAMGAMADIARHTQAIEDIEAAGTASLGELTQVAA